MTKELRGVLENLTALEKKKEEIETQLKLELTKVRDELRKYFRTRNSDVSEDVINTLIVQALQKMK